MLRNCDGTPYVPTGTFQMFNPANPDINLFNSLDNDLLLIAGTPIFYYEVHIQVNNRADLFYREDRTKIWSPNPIQLQGMYEPVASQNYLNMFGIDAPDEIKIELNYRQTLRILGHPPKIGSRIFTPHLRENWVVVQRNLGEFKLWNIYRMILIAQRFQESTTTNEGKVTQNQPNFGITSNQLFTNPNTNTGECC